MTDTTELTNIATRDVSNSSSDATSCLLKYAEGLTWRPIREASKQGEILWKSGFCGNMCVIRYPYYSECYDNDADYFMPLPDGKAGEVIKVLVEEMHRLSKLGADPFVGNSLGNQIAIKALTRATAILEGDNIDDNTLIITTGWDETPEELEKLGWVWDEVLQMYRRPKEKRDD